MKRKMIVKITVDIGMTVALLFLMAYELIGQAAHEWIGIGMFVLFIVHHILNSSWTKNILRGRYTAFRTVQTLLVLLVLAAMAGSMASGVMLSRYALAFLPIKGGRSFARTLHLLSAYWGFGFLSLHLGLHWRMMMAMAGKLWEKPSAFRTWVGRFAAFLVAGYGVYAFIKRGIGGYMTLRNQFVFFDFEEPLVFFFADYLAVMGLFVFLGHYFCEAVRRAGRSR